MKPLDDANEALRNYAEKNIKMVYQEITRTASKTPAAARAYEQTALIKYMLEVRNESQLRYSEAFASCGVEYPDLLWTQEVNPKLNINPDFKYCDVLASMPQDSGMTGQDIRFAAGLELDEDANPEKFAYAVPLAMGATGIAMKGAAAILRLGTHRVVASLLSATGTVLIVSGVAMATYTMFINDSPVPAVQLAGKGEEEKLFEKGGDAPTFTDLDTLMKKQRDYNYGVVCRWLEDVQALAENAVLKDATDR